MNGGSDSSRGGQKGSAIITVLVLAAVTALIASSFLSRASQEAKLATRSYFLSVSFHLAEAGLEEGMYAVNSAGVNAGNGWSLASGSTTDYVKTITTGFNFQQATGSIYIRIDDALAAAPSITAAGVITIPRQPKILKQLRIGSANPAKIWGNSMVAKGNVTFSGTADIDSYDSTVGPWNSATNRTDKATVSTTATVQISGSAYIFGYVATGGAVPNVGGSGRIYGATSPGTPLVDPARVRTDFNTNLTDATAPTSSAYSLGVVSLGGGSVSSLPRIGDVPGANGRYLYTCSSISIVGNSYITLKAPIDIICTGNTTVTDTSYISIGGTGAVNPSLNFYSPGNMSLTGTGMVNTTGAATNLAIWGTKPTGSTQTITFGNAAVYKGTIYAPNGNVSLGNSAAVHGAMIANTITLADSSVIHYDVKLAEATSAGGPVPGSGSGVGYLRPNKWCELTAAPGSGRAFARDGRTPFNTLF